MEDFFFHPSALGFEFCWFYFFFILSTYYSEILEKIAINHICSPPASHQLVWISHKSCTFILPQINSVGAILLNKHKINCLQNPRSQLKVFQIIKLNSKIVFLSCRIMLLVYFDISCSFWRPQQRGKCLSQYEFNFLSCRQYTIPNKVRIGTQSQAQAVCHCIFLVLIKLRSLNSSSCGIVGSTFYEFASKDLSLHFSLQTMSLVPEAAYICNAKIALVITDFN